MLCGCGEVDAGASDQLVVDAYDLVGPIIESAADEVFERVAFVFDQLRVEVEPGGCEVDDEGREDDLHLDRQKAVIEMDQRRDGEAPDVSDIKVVKPHVRGDLVPI